MMPPFSAQEFSRTMARLGPFERAPHVAVAVSGGRDSMALCLLAHVWARAAGGSVTALTVDHRLRAESAREADRVRSWLAAYGIAHEILVWEAPKPAAGVQAAAREARYRLMRDWCGRHGVLHLLTAHHREDQAETVLLRLQRNSGLDGLAGMSAVMEYSEVRLLRPLLDVPRGRLETFLTERGQDWIDDPSNTDPAYARTRLRSVMKDGGAEKLSAGNLTALAGRCAQARVVLEHDAAVLLARCCSLDPAGFARLDVTALRRAADEISLRALARVIRCIGGRAFAPRLDRLEAVHAALKEKRLGNGRTLGHCRLTIKNDLLSVFREARNLPEPVALRPGRSVLWDNRFVVEASAGAVAAARERLMLSSLGEAGWRDLMCERPVLRERRLPAPARAALPAFYDGTGVAFVPQMGFLREDLAAFGPDFGQARFNPRNALGDRGFVGFILQV
ncbi:MAG: tRNA lysidine(34) synthetase TilS [Rhodospirillales bacterium]